MEHARRQRTIDIRLREYREEVFRRTGSAREHRTRPTGQRLMPALPLHEAGKYVAAAYLVVFAIVLIYVAIMAAKLSRIASFENGWLDSLCG